MNIIRSIYDKTEDIAKHRYGIATLSFLFFIEAIFFFPVDPLLIVFCTQNRKQSFFYSTVAVLSSVLGAIVAYLIGMWGWDLIGSKLMFYIITPATFEKVTQLYKNYESLIVLIGAFTPIPYKAITLSAGFFKMPIIPFILFSIIGRGARFYLIGSLIYLFGDPIKKFIDRYFNLLVMLFMVVMVGSFFIIKV